MTIEGNMDIKKRHGKTVLTAAMLTTAILVALVATIQTGSAQSCDSGTVFNACGLNVSLNQTGHGAVELCSVCYACGVLDGVCPETFSDGMNETTIEKRTMVLRMGSDRPNTADSIIFATAAEACEVLNGTCARVIQKTTYNETWNYSGASLPCSTNVAANTNYLIAICNAPRTAGCQDCPDPDCVTSLSGTAFNAETNASLDVNINVVSDANPNIWNLQPSSAGTYTMDAPRGNIKVICTAPDYEPYIYTTFMQPKENRVDCRMNLATCSPECALPNDFGEDVCRTRCDGINGCLIENHTTYGYLGNYCEGIPPNTIKIIERINTTHCAAVTCCGGPVQTVSCPLFSLSSSNQDIKNIYTKEIRKQLQGSPVTLKIITYQKE